MAKLLRGPEAIGEGLREIGRSVFPRLAQTLIGRMLFGALGRNVNRVLMVAPAGWKICENFGDVRAVQLGPQHIRYTYTDHPIELIETIYVGSIEGAAPRFDVEIELGIALDGPRRTLLDIRWTSVGSASRRALR